MPWGGSSPRRPTASPWSYRLWWRSKMGRAAKRPSLWGTLGLALFAVVLVLLYWYAPALPEMARDYAREAFRLVGLGVAIPAFLLLVILILWRLGRLSFIWRRRWLALLAFSLAGWGTATLTDPTYAGEWGPIIFGPPTFLHPSPPPPPRPPQEGCHGSMEEEGPTPRPSPSHPYRLGVGAAPPGAPGHEP